MTDAGTYTVRPLFAPEPRRCLGPNHVAAIDNIVFGIAKVRSRRACRSGALFAIVHSPAVAVLALDIPNLKGRIRLPVWAGTAAELLVVALLVLVEMLDLAALLGRDCQVPVAWRARMLPASLRIGEYPVAILAAGFVLGLVVDTARQAGAVTTPGAGRRSAKRRRLQQ